MPGAAPGLEVALRNKPTGGRPMTSRPDGGGGTRAELVPGGLRSFDQAAFLRDCWQKQALLIRNPWARWRNPLEPDELAGLACESGLDSRLIIAGEPMEVEFGPLDPSRFRQLGAKPWTLLVQAVDHHVPAVAALIEPFRFIPNWRIDDVMVSYAVDGGGVGAHFDHYDVFLIQGLGRRRWQMGAACDSATALVPHDGLRLLADFVPTSEWILEPGDILYVPPGIAHNGLAVGDECMTYSVGFRAPSRRELLTEWIESLADDLAEDDRYVDPDLRHQENPGEITAEAITRLHAMITEKVGDRAAFTHWFGGHSTAPKNREIDWRPERAIGAEHARAMLVGGIALLRNPASRFSFVRQDAAAVLLFVDGECFACTRATASFAMRLSACDRLVVAPGELTSPTVALVADLFNRGSVAFDVGT